MASSTMQPENRLYDIACERRFADDRLPTADELAEALSTLGAVDEFFVSPISLGVIQIANSLASNTDAATVTLEDVARLINWADDVRLGAEDIIAAVEKVMVIARSDLFESAGAYFTNGTPFKDNGVLQDYEQWDRLRRHYGFGRTHG